LKSTNGLIDKLSSGQLCIGPGITLIDPLVTEVLADEVDFLWYDLEHCPLSHDVLNAHLLAARSRRKTAIVRVPTVDAGIIKQVLDSGANGIVVPQIKTVEEVKQSVSFCYYPPKGQRGFGPRVPSDFGRISATEVMEHANKNIFVSVMIETVEAVEAIEEIVKVNGLTSVVIGPADLSIAMGIPGELENPRLASTIKHVVEIANQNGVYVGAGLGADKAYANFLTNLGVQWLQLGSDFSYLINCIRDLKL